MNYLIAKFRDLVMYCIAMVIKSSLIIPLGVDLDWKLNIFPYFRSKNSPFWGLFISAWMKFVLDFYSFDGQSVRAHETLYSMSFFFLWCKPPLKHCQWITCKLIQLFKAGSNKWPSGFRFEQLDAGFTVSAALLCYCVPCIQCHGNFVKASETHTALCCSLRCTGNYTVVCVLPGFGDNSV